MATDREILKLQQLGALVTTDVVSPVAAISAAHSRSRDFVKVGTENAATNVAETLMFVTKRKCRPTVSYLTGTNVATDNTDYVVFKITKKTAGATGVLVASWNTHGGAQGAMTADIPATFVTVANADAIVAANDTLHYVVTKVAAGKVVAIGTIISDLEEI